MKITHYVCLNGDPLDLEAVSRGQHLLWLGGDLGRASALEVEPSEVRAFMARLPVERRVEHVGAGDELGELATEHGKLALRAAKIGTQHTAEIVDDEGGLLVGFLP